MDGKRNVVLFTAAFFLLAFVLLGCTLGMQLSLRAELDALPAAQEAQTTADPAETLASADAPNEASLVLTQTQPAASIAEQPEMTGRRPPPKSPRSFPRCSLSIPILKRSTARTARMCGI